MFGLPVTSAAWPVHRHAGGLVYSLAQAGGGAGTSLCPALRPTLSLALLHWGTGHTHPVMGKI